MPLPAQNNTFKQGDFSGYQVQGRCKVVSEFTYHSPFFSDVTLIRPSSGGKYFALLDDPRLVDSDGARLSDPSLPPPADTRAFQFMDAFTGMTTFGIDGAILEVPDVAISSGQFLQFRWRFLCYDTSAAGNNDFALFEAGDDAGPVYRTVLAQANALPSGGLIPWNTWLWQPAADFRGTLRWVASNGTTVDPPVPSSSNRARPSALLIDSIHILQA